MAVELCRPSVRELVFQLHERPLHPELFDVLASRRILRGDRELLLRITRTGHVIHWKNDALALTEVMAAKGDPLPSKHCRLSCRLRGEHRGEFGFAQGVRYQMNCQVELLPAEVFLHVHDEILADGAERGLLHQFQAQNRLCVAPLGFITLEGWKNGVAIHAFHTFPDEFAVVKSQSLIEAGER